jgi:lipocalin-like protein
MRKSQVVRFLGSITAASALMLCGASQGWAQQTASAKQLVGTWTLVSATVTQADGKKVLPFGSQGQGMLVFDAAGRYSLQICRPDRPKFASGNREKGSPEENQATVQGCNPHWGRYTVSGDAIVFNIERAMFPNWEGIQQKRTFTITGDQLKYAVPAASGGGTAEVIWKRAN